MSMFVIFDKQGLVYGITRNLDVFAKDRKLTDVPGRDGYGSLNTESGALRFTYAYGPSV